MMYYVYILYSKSQNIFYKGQTNDLKDRFSRHNSGSEKFTKIGLPWTLIWVTEKDTRVEALSLEKKLKNLSVKRTIEFIERYKDGIAGPDAFLLLEKMSGC